MADTTDGTEHDAGGGGRREAPTRNEPADDRRGSDGERRLPAGPTYTRRRFAAGAGAALLAPLAARLTPWNVGDGGGPPGGVAADGRTAPVTRPDGRVPGGGTQQEQEEEKEPPGTAALVDYVEARWGDRLSADDLEQIRSSVAGNLRAASAIDEVSLANADEPAFVFRPYRGEGS